MSGHPKRTRPLPAHLQDTIARAGDGDGGEGDTPVRGAPPGPPAVSHRGHRSVSLILSGCMLVIRQNLFGRYTGEVRLRGIIFMLFINRIGFPPGTSQTAVLRLISAVESVGASAGISQLADLPELRH